MDEIPEAALRVVIADDHPAFLAGLGTLLASRPEVDVVGEATTGAEAVRVVAATRPDVVVMDLRMPGMTGIDATRQLLHELPTIGVLVLTMLEEDDSVFAAMRAGARGYLLKGAGQEDIVRAIVAVGRGEAIFGPSIAQRVLAHFARPATSADNQPFPELTQREREVLDAIARGEPNPEIARRLQISGKTVKNYVSAIFAKMQVADRGQAIVRAREAGLGIGPNTQ
jgi:DNA-binding NarL/FixJ family response regulator